MVYEEIKSESFNITTIKIVDSIINQKKIDKTKLQIFEKFVYNALISIIKLSTNAKHDDAKIYLRMKKSLFINIIADPLRVYKINEMMQIIHSKFYLFSNLSKKITRKIFYLMLTNHSHIRNIYLEYDKYIMYNLMKIENNIEQYDSCLENINQNQSTDNELHDYVIVHGKFKIQIVNSPDSESLLQNSSNSTAEFSSSIDVLNEKHDKKTLISIKKHPFQKYVEIFCDLVYHTYEFYFYDENNNLTLTFNLINRLKFKNSFFISNDVFFASLDSFEKATNSTIIKYQDNFEDISFGPKLRIYSFLEHLKENFCYPHIELGYGIDEMRRFIDLFITCMHPKSISLNITKFYSHMFLTHCEEQNNLSISKFNELIHMILNRVFYLKLQINTFSIELTKSRLFDITDVNITSKGSFAPSLHTSIRCMKKISTGLLQMISSLYVNTYMSKNQRQLKFFNFNNQYLNVVFFPGTFKINGMFIPNSHHKCNIKHVNAIIEDNCCSIEIQRLDDKQIVEKNYNTNNNNKPIDDTNIPSQMLSHTEEIPKTSCKSEIVSEFYTSFLIFLQNFLKIKSRTKTSYVFVTSTSKMDIQNCKIDFLFRSPQSMEFINIANSILLNSYPREERKQDLLIKSNTNISIRRSHLTQNILAGSFKKITIQDCNTVMHITALFEVIEICGVFDDVKITGRFHFHFKSEKCATFLFIKEKKYLKASNIHFFDYSFLTFIEFRNLTDCNIE